RSRGKAQIATTAAHPLRIAPESRVRSGRARPPPCRRAQQQRPARSRLATSPAARPPDNRDPRDGLQASPLPRPERELAAAWPFHSPVDRTPDLPTPGSSATIEPPPGLRSIQLRRPIPARTAAQQEASCRPILHLRSLYRPRSEASHSPPSPAPLSFLRSTCRFPPAAGVSQLPPTPQASILPPTPQLIRQGSNSPIAPVRYPERPNGAPLHLLAPARSTATLAAAKADRVLALVRLLPF